MTTCDIVLRGGRVIDPANGLDAICDIAISDGRIAGIASGLDAVAAGQSIDCTGKLVLPGLIDTHGHIFRHVTGRFGLDPDMCGVHSGVTTMIDQGGPSLVTLGAFRKWIHEPSKTRILANLSAYVVGGLEGHAYVELYRPECCDVDGTVRAAQQNRDIVKGIKAHAELGGFMRWGLDVMKLAATIGREAELPVYVHFGQLWPTPEIGRDIDPDKILAETIDVLRPGDILAHPFSRHPGGFVSLDGKVAPVIKEALARGLRVDVGHGSHFSFRMARLVLDAGILPDTLGADMHGYNTRVPGDPPVSHLFTGNERFSLVSAMTSMLALGVPFDHVVRMVTVNAARMAGMASEIGTLGVGRVADVSVLDDARGRWTLRDNDGTTVTAERLLTPAFCLRAGEMFRADASILPMMEAA